jgi:tetratricopeptide (TPR) repeat protein
MKKESGLFIIIGALVGFIVGFAFANTTNQRGYAAQTTSGGQGAQMAGLPHDHPPIEGVASGPNAAAVDSLMKIASEQPDNFDAQVKAAEIAYAADRYDDAIKLFASANRLRPERFEVLVGLGNTNFDAERFEEAERWYTAALKQQPDNVNIRTDLGLTFFFREPRDLERAIKEYRASLERDPNHAQTLQNLTVALTIKGDAEAARETLSKLELVNPQNPALPRLRADLDVLNSPGQTAAKISAIEKGGR